MISITTRVIEWAMSLPPFIPRPATGADFVGRQGLVKNLRRRLEQGESVAVIGGPKLGKTSLVRTALEGLTDCTVIEVRLNEGSALTPEEMSGVILVLDNLDDLPRQEIDYLLARISQAKPRNIVFTGGFRLRALLHDTSILPSIPVRLYPLSVLLDGELRQLLGPDRDGSIAMWTGNHPYLAKIFLHYGEAALSEGRRQWEPFVRELTEQIGTGAERQLLHYLIAQGKPVNPLQAGAETGVEQIKSVADRLVYTGAISRWIRNDEATLFAGCRLLNHFITGLPFDLMK